MVRLPHPWRRDSQGQGTIYIVKLGNRCTLKLEKATKALFAGFFSCYLSLKVPHGQDCIKTQAYGIKI